MMDGYALDVTSRETLDFYEQDGSWVIQTGQIPRHWYNYLWNDQGYCAQVSELGHGASWCMDAEAHLCRVNADGARHLSVRDDRTGTFLVVGPGLPGYRCTHHISHTTIQAKLGGIIINWRICVPVDGTHELWDVTLSNTGADMRSVSVFSLVSIDLDGFDHPRYYEMYRSCESFWVGDLNGVFISSAHPFAPDMPCQAFIASNRPVDGFDGDLLPFLGSDQVVTRADGSQAGWYRSPRVVAQGGDCTGSVTANFMLGGVLQHKIDLAPGEVVSFAVVAGLSRSLQDAVSVVAGYRITGAGMHAVAAIEKRDADRYGTASLVCPEDRINRVCNQWLRKQVDFCLVGKKGVRDNLQIAVALLQFRPEKAKDGILEVLAHQFQDGHAVLTWQPYDDTRYSDQPFWIIWAVVELVKETGDRSVLDQVVPWQDGGSGTVLKHCKAAAHRLAADRGPHGLCRIFFADWNDALNITTDPEAESVMLSEQACLALGEFGRLCRWIGDASFGTWLDGVRDDLAEAITTVAWDGDRYVRALHRDGVVGGRASTGSTVYLNAQTWAVLAGIVDEARLPLVLQTIDSMEHEFGFPINDPPYASYDPQVGRMSGMLAGLYENGGVYCHASAFKMLMDCSVGRGDEALRTLLKILPDSEANPSMRSGAEPYVCTNCYATHPKYYGKSYQSWTTGTSAWVLMGIYQGMAGLHRDFDGLHIQPCMPGLWPSLDLVRTFRGCEWHIRIEHCCGAGDAPMSIEVDGCLLEAQVLPVFSPGTVHEANVMVFREYVDREVPGTVLSSSMGL